MPRNTRKADNTPSNPQGTGLLIAQESLAKVTEHRRIKNRRIILKTCLKWKHSMQQTNKLQHGIKIRVLFLLSLETRKQAKTCKYRQRASNLLDCSFSLAHSFFILAIYSPPQSSIPTSLCNSEICLFFSLISVFRSFKTVSYRFTNSLNYITQMLPFQHFPYFPLCFQLLLLASSQAPGTPRPFSSPLLPP